MICYKDMTFCGFWKECKGGQSCERALKDTVLIEARKLNLLVARFMIYPNCFKQKEKEDK